MSTFASSEEEARLVFNVVWTGSVFDHLEPFAASQLAQSSARFRFIANACPPEAVRALERFAEGRMLDEKGAGPYAWAH